MCITFPEKNINLNCTLNYGTWQVEKSVFIPKSNILLRYQIFMIQYLFEEIIFLHTVFNIEMCKTCFTMFSEKYLVHSNDSFSVAIVTQ